jgi:hypothetical protein
MALPPGAATEIAVVDSSGTSVPRPYAALVAADAPWSSPIAEAVGTAIRFEVPPCTYRLVASAPGFASEWRETFIVRAEPRTERVILQPLASVAGRVVDAEGKPVASARIASYFDRIPDHPRRLSPVGERHLRADAAASSDADGYFALRVPASGETLVLVEACGMAPRVIDGVSAGSDRLSNVVLERGAALAARHNSATGVARVELIPVRTALDASLPAHRAIRLWRRSASDASWDSLPAGTYDVAIRDGTSADPVVVARVELSSGAAKSIALPALPAPTTGKAVIAVEHDGTLAATRWRDGASTPAAFTSPHPTRIVLDDCRPGDMLVLMTRERVGAVRLDRCDGTSVPAGMPSARCCRSSSIPPSSAGRSPPTPATTERCGWTCRSRPRIASPGSRFPRDAVRSRSQPRGSGGWTQGRCASGRERRTGSPCPTRAGPRRCWCTCATSSASPFPESASPPSHRVRCTTSVLSMR